MRNLLSIAVLTAAFALLVPDNGAQAVNAAEALRPAAAAQSPGVMGLPAVSGGAEGERTGDPDLAWLLALGFLGAVMARRLRAD